MSKQPRLAGQECGGVLLLFGFHVMRRDDPFAQLTVPGRKELDRGTLRAIIRQAGLSVEEFVEQK